MGIRSEYKRLLKTGELKADPAQKAAIEALFKLERRIRHSRSWLRALLGIRPKCYGMYLWGPPGRGKSMMMDIFYHNAHIKAKHRVHFHAFMSEVHHLIRKWRESDAATRKRIFGTHKGDDPIAPTAKLIAKRSQLLCFDELQVTDIADAMILGRLFEALFANKVILVTTSNRPPQDLYKNGLNRDLFVPFIDMIKDRLQVVEVAGPRDFRLDRLRGAKTYFFPSTDPQSRAGFETLWADMTRLNTEMECVLTVNERKLTFKRAAGPLLRATFAELCAANNGAADYLAIAERFTTVFIEDVPIMSPANRNEARRFVSLIDALYEDSTKTVLLAAAEPSQLYPSGDGAFEFERTVSRLEEMRSEDYLARASSHAG
ncbi:AFG1-like ATPase family protein [Asticcacaulis biprosthecium C19]|uniref:AFG1-like ATPase family protein n=1 Tax=Asticcacaulis biprosthecium C19 TaxID=715226 RepID=F4QKH7_9CAUL|nr:cell division protein ZapE [Asticcacaulis biprosthecium]EGF92129.1 AFG1-like ATPase family protein [Asticcacaulis biprosthecium C19]